MSNLEERVRVLDGLRGQLNANDAKFVHDLIHGKWGFYQRGYLSGKQAPWIERLIERAENGGQLPNEKCGVSLAKVKDFLLAARKTLKAPKVWMRTEDGRDLKVYIAGQRSKVPNAVNFVLYDQPEGGWRNDTWLGRVLDNGDWHRPYSTKQEDVDMIQPLLVRLGEDPAGAASDFGKLTGRCCFCNSALSDKNHSTLVGYGPTCAKKWGLYDEWKAAKAAAKGS